VSIARHCTPTDRRIGLWSAIIILALAAIYLMIGAAWLVFGDRSQMSGLEPPEPCLTVERALMMSMTPPIIALFASIHAHASPDRTTFSRVALAHIIVFATITGADNFLLVAVMRHGGTGVSSSDAHVQHLAPCFPDMWPAVIRPLELFAWGPVFGLALLFAAPIFKGDRLQTAIRALMTLAGALCVTNVMCFITGDGRFAFAGIVGYDCAFPVICILLAVLFGRGPSPATID
jgi:hypothetical protein